VAEGTWSGELYGDAEPSALAGTLAGEPAGAAVLGLCSAERLSVIAERLVVCPPAATAVRAGLDLGWAAVAAGRAPCPGAEDDAIGRAVSELDALAYAESSDVPEFQSELNSALCAAAYALEAVRDGSPAAAALAVDYCRDVHFQLAVSAWPRLGLDALIASPVVQGEVRRQVAEARAIAAWGGAISAERVESMRRAAHADGVVLVNVIRGGPREEDQGPVPGGQEPLF
jgi:hypothetical protein